MDRIEWWWIINISLNSSLGGLNSTLKAKCSKGVQNETVSETEDTCMGTFNSLRAGSLVWVGYHSQRRQRTENWPTGSFARDTLPKQVSLFAGYCLRTETDPQKCLSVITVDGMDEAKTNIPHVTSMSKASSNVPWKKKCQSLTISREWSMFVYVPDGAVPLPLNAYHRSNLSWTEESDVFCWPLTMETWLQSDTQCAT